MSCRGAAVPLLAVLTAGSAAWGQEHTETELPGVVEGRPSYETATGTLEAYDAVTHVLTVRSATGSSEFRVAADARFWLGRRRLPLSKLAVQAGAQVTVAWSDSEGVRTTHTVRVADPRAAQRK
jgi:hypothetical protein